MAGSSDGLRADARRNREQIVAAAREVFLEQGVGAPLEEIARRAGVGIATLYRRFPDRHVLVREVALDNMAVMGEELDRATAEHADAWGALARLLRRLVALRLGVFMPMLATTLEGEMRGEGGELKVRRDRIVERLDGLVAGARRQGWVREGIGALDLLAAVIKLSRPLPVLSAELNELLTQRQLELFLGGLRATALDAVEPLRPQPLTLAELDRRLTAAE